MKLSGDDKSSGSWILIAPFSLLFVMFVKWWWPNAIPFEVFQFWKNNKILEGIIASWPIFLWGGGLTALYSVLNYNSRETNRNAEDILINGAVLSALAGVFEEMAFRWIFFLAGIVGVKVSNFLFFGWLGFGLGEWLHLNLFGPIVNFLTLEKMEWLIFGMGWAVGAAALGANAKFRKEHAYLGLFGYFNSWIIGFFLFWMMFNYGLLTAIIVHFLYDMLIFTVRYIDAAVERALGRG